MGRSPRCDVEVGVKKGPWTPEEDKKLVDYINENGHGSWRNLPKNSGLNRCGKSCRLRWTNYLRPDVKRGKFAEDEERLIIHLHSVLGNKWSAIATRLPGRTDNEIKNYWNTHLRKKLLLVGIDPVTHRPRRTDLDILASLPGLLAAANHGNDLAGAPWNLARCADDQAAHLAKFQMLQTLARLVSSRSTTYGPTSSDVDTMNLLASSAPSLLGGTLSINQDLVTLPSLSDTEVPTNSFGTFSDELYISMNLTTANSTPSLVSADQINPDEASANSSGSTQFEAWEGLNPDDDDLCWKDILDQITFKHTVDEGGASHSWCIKTKLGFLLVKNECKL